MNGKKMKKLLGCVCTLTMLFGSIPTNGIVASAEGGAADTYVNILENENITLHGVTYDSDAGIFVRMDLDTAAGIANINRDNYSFTDKNGELVNNVYVHAREASGGRIRFSTDSSYVAIKATLWDYEPAYARRMGDGKYGFDVYEDSAEGSTYVGTVSVETAPTEAGEVLVEGTVNLGEAGTMRNLTIYFPITTETKSVGIAVETGYDIQKHSADYDLADKRILFYGSSITQGGAVSRPGLTYVNTVARNLNMEYLNLGVWGSCKAQPAFAEYMKTLGNISAFVYDYDHNNKAASALEATHYQFYKLIRDEYKNIPIIMITRPGKSIESDPANSTVAEMKEVIYESYQRAVDAGDKNVHFIDGETFFGYSKAFLPDNVHPNDAGQAKMAEVVEAVLRRAFAGEENVCVEPANCEKLLFEEDFEEGINTTWNTNQTGVTDTAFTAIQKGENNTVGQITYTRPAGTGGYGGAYYSSGFLKNYSNYVIEMDTTIYKGATLGDWSYLEFSLRMAGITGKLNVRIAPKANVGWAARLYDETGSTEYSDAKEIEDEDFKAVFDSATEYTCRVRLAVEYITNSDGSTSFAITVYVDDNQAGFYITPGNQEWKATSVRFYMYGGSVNDTENDVYKADIDNIKVYDMSHTLEMQAEVPSTTEQQGVKEHLECTVCGKKFVDEAAIIEATAADLAIGKNCLLVDDDFDSDLSKWGAPAGKNFNSFEFNTKNSTLEMKGTKTGTGVPYAYVQYGTGVLNGYADYVIEMQDVIIHRNAVNWSQLGLYLRDRNSSNTLEFRIQYNSSGLAIVPFYNGTRYNNAESALKELGYVKIFNAELKEMYDKQEDYFFDLRMEVEGMGTNSITCTFTVGETVKSITIPNFEIAPTGLRLYLYGTSDEANDNTVYQTSIGDIKVYSELHNMREVAADASTDTEPGTKAHYKCAGCGKKFLDETGVTEVTDAQLVSSPLKAIKYQCAANKTNAANKDVRFVAYVDDYTKYQKVIFEIECGELRGSAESKSVYTAIYADGERVTPGDVYGQQGHFAAFVLKNNTVDELQEMMKVTVTLIGQNGEEIKCTPREITVLP